MNVGLNHFTIEIRTYSETVPDINDVINYLKPLGLSVDNIRITAY